jgi:hypothetical protein
MNQSIIIANFNPVIERNLKSTILYILLCLITSASAQPRYESITDSVLSVCGFTRKDVSLPFFEYGEESRSNHKLLIEQVKNSLLNPLVTTAYINRIKNLKNSGFVSVLDFLFETLSNNTAAEKYGIDNFRTTDEFCAVLKRNRNERNNLLAVLNDNEKQYLKNNIFELLIDSENYNRQTEDIFRYNGLRDSGLIKSERLITILSKIDRDKFYSNLLTDAYLFDLLYGFIKSNPDYFRNLKFSNYNTNELKGSFSMLDFSGVEIVIGNYGKNSYHGNFDIIIDLSGNDLYEIENPVKTSSNWIIDLNGDDRYSALSDFSIAGSFLSSSFILDAGGNDVYEGKNASLGTGIAGISVLVDLKGDDTYTGGFISCGAGMFGTGLLYDNEGNDSYMSDGYSQGFGMTQGMGMILDNQGSDKYNVKPVVKDITRYEDHYKSMSQGFGTGIRPYYAGGIGIILDSRGNDLYSSDIYGQGSAYWFASGFLIDEEGNDIYKSYQYSQGAGIHFASGFLEDDSGNDIYSANGVSQGCGHDYGFGLLLDGNGNDNYSAYSLSQGTGNANGIGFLADLSGTDIYLSKDNLTTRGYGNPRRETVSLGIFIDAGQLNYYSVNGTGSGFSIKPENGIFAELHAGKEKKENKTNEYKIPFTEKEYSTDELFIMAKTIEPRFSEWQKYGFNKLITASMKTTAEVLKYLSSEDTRDKLVLFNLMNKIGYSLSKEISGYAASVINSSKPDYEKEEIVSYACYLLGEYGSHDNTGLIISLLDYNSIKVKSSALNALYKIKDTINSGLITDKLNKLKNIKTDYIQFYKDLVLCLAAYESDSTYLSLLGFLDSEYHFSVRIPAAGALKILNIRYSHLIDGNVLDKFAHDEISEYWLINSLSEVSKDEYDRIMSILKQAAH